MSTFQVPENCGSLFVDDVEDLLGIGRGESYLICNGRVVSRSDPLVQGCIYHILPRVLGGKGGFGSMLRAIGAQIEKTTSREACRDLSGRRIRDVNNEKKLKDWVSKQGDREREMEERRERRRAKRAKYLQDTPAKMDNPEYDAQYKEIMKKSEAAIQEGLARLKEGGAVSRKRKAGTTAGSGLDKYDRWNMMGGLNPEDLDSDSGSDSGEGCSADPGPGPGPSAVPDDMVSSSSSPSSSSQGPSSPKASATVTSSTVTSGTGASSHTAEGEPPHKQARVEGGEGSEEAAACSSREKGEEASSTEREGGAGVMKNDDSQSQVSSSDGAPAAAAADPVESTEPIDLDHYSSCQDLQALGMERLKADLMRRGLKCGGSLEERAQRLFSVKGLATEDIPAKLLAKGKGQGKSSRR
ncbi:splicing regulator SDE2-like [Babylonia areolata]|uniref:splicing regulator SDE2-like n=1 Tax=Babylonia areolata TaxID=304850 RepID=UPI003FD6B216